MKSFRPDPELAALLLKMRVSIRKEFGVALDIYAEDAITRFISYGFKSNDAELLDTAKELLLRFPDTNVIDDIADKLSDRNTQPLIGRSYRGSTVTPSSSQASSDAPSAISTVTDSEPVTGKPGQKQRFYRGSPIK